MSHVDGNRGADPVFVVGAPRSGTTMLAAMIGSHSHFAAGPESQFFSKLSPQALTAAISDPQWPAKAVAAISSLTLADQQVFELFGTTRKELTAYLRDRKPCERNMLEALTAPLAVRQNKPAWVEKTPNHLLNLEQIRTLWPEAKVVRIMRDPRDAALSTTMLPTFSNSFAANIYLWRAWQDIGQPFFDRDILSYTVRYESLIINPAQELERLCKFLSVEYEPLMLGFSQAANLVSSPNEVWKTQVSKSLTKDRLFAWKRTLGSDDRALANLVTYEYLQKFQYEHGPRPTETRAVYRMSPLLVERLRDHLVVLAGKGERWLPAQSPRAADMIAEPPQHKPFRHPWLIARLIWARLALCRISKSSVER